jgi:serpin B
MPGLLARLRQWLPSAAVPVQRPPGLNGDSTGIALEMYRQLAASPGDIAFSPFSLRVALTMVLAGARGSTAAELRQLLGIAEGDTLVHETLGQICRDLRTTGVNGSLGTANSLWIANHHPVTSEFEALAVSHYQGDIHTVDLASAATIAEMNRWVAERTFGRITDLIGELDSDSRLVLINALAFRGKWLTPFLPDATDDDLFTLADGQRRIVPMMSQVMRVGYAEQQDLQAVNLDYEGGRLSMVVVLPSARAGLGRLEDTLSAQALAAFDSELRVRKVSVSIPRFKISTAGSLVPLMKSLGLRHSFDRETADFSGINGRRPPDAESLFISDVVQKAVVDVNEQGTEAVAASAVKMARVAAAMRPRGPVIPVFRADHPFLFAIRDRASGEILFIGRVAGSGLEEPIARDDGDDFDPDLPPFIRVQRR